MPNTKHFESVVQLDSGLIIPASAAAGATLQSDATGHATWQVSGTARQNLRIPILTPCAAVSVVNLPLLEGLLEIDGIKPVVGNLVLLTAQTEAKNNGLWTVAEGAWTRPAEFFTGFEIKAAREVTIISGKKFKRSRWFLAYTEPVIVGTTAHNWTQMGIQVGVPFEINTARKQGVAITPSTEFVTNVYINVQGNAESWAFKVEVLIDGNTVASEGVKGPGTSQYAFAAPFMVDIGGTYQVNITETTGKVTPTGEFRTTYQRVA